MPIEPTLVCLPYSPFSERARWALDHHGIAYRIVAHHPFVGEWRLRRMVGAKRGERATVPVLLGEGQRLRDSWEIVQYAERRGRGEALVPDSLRERILEHVQLADRGANHGRAVVTLQLLEHPEALDETLPPAVPAFLRARLRPVTRFGARWFARKYGTEGVVEQREREAFASVLAELERRLSGRDYLLERFTYADIALCMLLQCVAPVDSRYIRLGPGTRRAWSQPALAERYAGLVAWRDRLYAAHR